MKTYRHYYKVWDKNGENYYTGNTDGLFGAKHITLLLHMSTQPPFPILCSQRVLVS